MRDHRQGFAARRAGPPASSTPRACTTEDRAAWRRVIALAAVQARAVAESAPVMREAAADFAHEVIAVSRLRFPLEPVSAQCAAEAFLIAARGFVAAARPQDRGPLAALMGAGAAALEQLFVNAADEAAQVWKRQLGEGN